MSNYYTSNIIISPCSLKGLHIKEKHNVFLFKNF